MTELMCHNMGDTVQRCFDEIAVQHYHALGVVAASPAGFHRPNLQLREGDSHSGELRIYLPHKVGEY